MDSTKKPPLLFLNNLNMVDSRTVERNPLSTQVMKSWSCGKEETKSLRTGQKESLNDPTPESRREARRCEAVVVMKRSGKLCNGRDLRRYHEVRGLGTTD